MADEEVSLGVLIETIAKNTAELDALQGKINNLQVTTTRHAVAAREATVAERDLSREAGISARAFGELGAKGGEMAERFTNLTTAAGGLQGTMMGLGLLGLGGVVEGTKAVIEQSEKHERAVEDLKQAYESSGTSLDQYRGQMEDWLKANRAFISDQDVAREGFAEMTRAGLDQEQVLRGMNVALDVSALKHISLAEAEHQVLLGLEGNARGLKDLGINLDQLKKQDDNATKAHKDFEEATKKVATAQDQLTRSHEALHREEDVLHGKRKVSAADLDELQIKQENVKRAQDELARATSAQKDASDRMNSSISTTNQTLQVLEERTAEGRKSTTDLERSQHELSAAEEDFGNRVGPTVAKSLAQDIEWLLKAGEAVQGLTGWFQGLAHAASEAQISSEAAQGRLHQGGRQAGGPVFAGGTYTVGESGPETLVMGAGAGFVVPSAPASAGGVGIDMDDTNEILAAIHQVLVTRLQAPGGGLSTSAYASRA